MLLLNVDINLLQYSTPKHRRTYLNKDLLRPCYYALKYSSAGIIYNGPGSTWLHYIAFYYSSALYLVLEGNTKCHSLGYGVLRLDTLTFHVRHRDFISGLTRLPLTGRILIFPTRLVCWINRHLINATIKNERQSVNMPRCCGVAKVRVTLYLVSPSQRAVKKFSPEMCLFSTCLHEWAL